VPTQLLLDTHQREERHPANEFSGFVGACGSLWISTALGWSEMKEAVALVSEKSLEEAARYFENNRVQ